MKRKLLLIFLTIISAACLCFSLTACSILDDFLNSVGIQTENSQSSDDDAEEDAEEGSPSEDSEEDLPSDDSEEDSSDEDSEEDSEATGGNSETSNSDTEGDSTSEDNEGYSTNDGTEEDSEDSEEDSSGDGSNGQDSSDDNETEENTEQDSSDDNETEEDTEQDSSDDNETEEGTEQDSSNDDSESEEESGETSATFTAREGNSTYGYSKLAAETNGDEMQSLYYQMYAACEAFIAGTDDISTTNGYYVISKISYDVTTAEAVSVWKVFYLDNPMYYWLYSSCVYSTSSVYICIDEAYASYAVRAVYDEDISAMIAEASALTAQKSTELEKAMAIHDYIISKIDYAYQSDGVTPETAIWAHNITGVSSKGYGVCEAYSKTYLALCLISGLDCVIATGYASGESHAWNLVKIDGVWYGVDCTWDDTGDDDLSYVYFGMNASEIDDTRTTGSQTYDVNYLYELPEVTACGIQLVTLFEDGTELGTYINIDAAFSAMTDSAADYTIELYFYSSTGTLVYTSPSTTVYIYSATTPAVNSITINGVYTNLGGGYFYVSYLNIESSFTLSCNLEIGNLILYAADFDLGEYTLTTSGSYCRLDGTIYDDKTTDTISMKSTISDQTVVNASLTVSYYYGGATLNGVAVIGTYYGSDMLIVYGTVTIDEYISANETGYYNVYLQGGASLCVNSLVYDSDGSNRTIYALVQFDSVEEYPSLYLGNVDAKTYLYVSGYISASEAADPANLDCVIATLGDADDFANIRIYFGNVNQTSSYTVNTDNEIVYKT